MNLGQSIGFFSSNFYTSQDSFALAPCTQNELFSESLKKVMPFFLISSTFEHFRAFFRFLPSRGTRDGFVLYDIYVDFFYHAHVHWNRNWLTISGHNPHSLNKKWLQFSMSGRIAINIIKTLEFHGGSLCKYSLSRSARLKKNKYHAMHAIFRSYFSFYDCNVFYKKRFKETCLALRNAILVAWES